MKKGTFYKKKQTVTETSRNVIFLKSANSKKLKKIKKIN